MGSRISNTEWWFIVGALAMLDVVQFVLDFFAIGVIANRFIDPVVAGSFLLYLPLRGYKLDPRTLILLGASFVAEEVPLLDAGPFWTFDGWKIMQWDKANQKNAIKPEEETPKRLKKSENRI